MPWLVPSKETARKLTKAKKMKRCFHICWYEDGKIRKMSTGTKDRKEAERQLIKFIDQQEEQQKGFERTLFSEAAEELVRKRVREKNLAERTQKRYRTLTDSFLEFVGPGIMTHEITPDMVDRFRDWAREQVTVTTRSGEIKKKPRLADKTLDMILQFIKAVLSFSYERGYVQKNVAAEITSIPRAKIEQKAVRGFTDEELTAILTSDSLDPNIRMCFLGLLHLGVRRGELEKITWNNVDLKARTVRVYGEKVNRWRTVPISDALLPHLVQAHAERGRRKHVFCRPDGGPANKHLYRSLMRVCKEVGIDTEGVHLHSFRHSFIQRHLEAGVNFKTIMTWSGHSDIKTFMVYLDQYVPKQEHINKARYDFLDIPLKATSSKKAPDEG